MYVIRNMCTYPLAHYPQIRFVVCNQGWISSPNFGGMKGPPKRAIGASKQ
jgi:hypothetical protein